MYYGCSTELKRKERNEMNENEWYKHYGEAMQLICSKCTRNESCSDGEVKECKVAEAVRNFFIEGEKENEKK